MKVMRSNRSDGQTNKSNLIDSVSHSHWQHPRHLNSTISYYESRKRKYTDQDSKTSTTTSNDKHLGQRRSLTPTPSPPCLCDDYLLKKRRHSSFQQGKSNYTHSSPHNITQSQQQQQQQQQQQRYVLVTGGAGYIGSHTVLELLHADYSIVVMDNLVNANLEALARVEYLAGKSIYFVEGDITCENDLEKVFQEFHFWAVIHFAAIKAVGESTRIPLEYYHNNVTGSLHLFRVMNRYKVKNLVFSSSATVYGEPDMMPVNETASLGPVTNPYGRTKLFVEEMLRDVCASDPEWNVCLLRFFNPVGAHPSGLMGECPQGIPNNLLPYVIRVLQGHLPYVQIFGSDYDTVDGTGVRDYIHVCDLATGHVAALKKLEGEEDEMKKGSTLTASSSVASSPTPHSTASLSPPSTSSSPLPSSQQQQQQQQQLQGGHCVAYNLGTGVGYSVLEIINAMEKATQRTIPYKIVDRRPGDVGVCTADATLANRELGWKPLYTMDDMCQDMWRWTRRNPNGYDGPLIDGD
ncbi:hypothetical protein BC941DRAFT_470401 [Chlamydoabsidia padenii]|nr:hypothetical protein BC941DRAFT_470401 [Chlamydoabsidia padenii]